MLGTLNIPVSSLGQNGSVKEYRGVPTTTQALEFTTVLDRLAEAATKALGCKGAVIRLRDRGGGHAEIARAYGLGQIFSDRVRPALSAPLIGERGVIGSLHVYGQRTCRFSEDDTALLKSIAAMGVVAIERTQACQTLEDLDRDKSQFVRIFTHELRSPVQVTSSLLNVLGQGYVGDLSERQADLVERARRRVKFLEILIDDLLDLAAGKAGALADPKRDLISLTGVLQEVCARHEALARDKGLALQCDCPDDGFQMWADRCELDRVFNNLVNNAVKYTPAGGVRVHVERSNGSVSAGNGSVRVTNDCVRVTNDCVRVTIADTGIGIPQDALPRLFEEFFRARNAKALQETGTGLGLAIVKDLVERYDGQIEVKSTEGEGTTFSVTLPLA
jgi:signal transduction histidine kinase